MKIIATLIVIVLFMFLIYLVQIGQEGEEEKIVTKIIDGDTIIVQGGETVRLLGLDCDERGKTCYQPAKDYLEEVLLNELVVIEIGSEDKDIYGRSLRWVFLNEENINNKLILEGYCVARIYGNSEYEREIVKSEEIAIKNQIGCKWKQEEDLNN